MLVSAEPTPPLFKTIFQGGLETIGSDAYGYSNPDNPKSIGYIIADIIQIALGFLGIIFLTLIIYSGLKWLTSGGNDDTVSKARKVIVHAVIGLLIVLAAYSITYFVITTATTATQEGTTYDVYQAL